MQFMIPLILAQTRFNTIMEYFHAVQLKGINYATWFFKAIDSFAISWTIICI